MTFTLILRRIHLYVALFFIPWVLIYGVSTAFMNHMPFFAGLYGERWGAYEPQQEMTYEKPLPLAAADGADAKRIDAKAAGRQILRDLGLDGAFWANTSRDGSRLTIGRMSMVWPRRITWTAADRKIEVERQTFQLPMFLRRLHTRRGYGQGYLADDLWAFGVDAFIIAILVWGATGLWLWYRMRRGRRWGAVCVAVGCVLFAFFVWMI